MIESSQATVVPCSRLRQTYDELCRKRQIVEQFERLSALKPLVKKVTYAALQPNNVAKNRNVDIIPDDQLRPYLLTPWKGSTNYINAVFVHGYKERNAYIVAQSPMTTTVVDMWRLLADHESRTVVMLDDSDVTDDQCSTYWPTKEGTTQQFGPFKVKLVQTGLSATSNIIMREFTLAKSGSNKESATVVKQFHLTNAWSQGASLPSNKTVVIELMGLVEKWQQHSGNGPVTIHCSDGASRCGLLCAASYVLEHLKVEQEVDIFHAVQHIRTTRPQLITDLDQYGFLYEIALEYMSLFDEYANFR
ncbi:Receptor-type tyrosine-protein phosphatase kappa [Lamellibrachia satsuma]|nr:Receptor-type tyrosine-protein phosphatase kappa [Lamellibrachia satsuma]